MIGQQQIKIKKKIRKEQIYIHYSPITYFRNLDRGIPIPKYDGQKDDRILLDLLEVLLCIHNVDKVQNIINTLFLNP